MRFALVPVALRLVVVQGKIRTRFDPCTFIKQRWRRDAWRKKGASLWIEKFQILAGALSYSFDSTG
ncbi:hypothetical protein [Polaromonas sp. CG9_12]|nr:hypothetical protein [Polaromonas sp. CG9_12]